MNFKKKLKQRYDATLPIVQADESHSTLSRNPAMSKRRILIAASVSCTLIALGVLIPTVYFGNVGSGGGPQFSSVEPPKPKDRSGDYPFEGEICKREALSLKESSLMLNKGLDSFISNVGMMRVTITRDDYCLAFIDSYLSSCTFIASEDSYSFQYEEQSYRLFFEFGASQTDYVAHIRIFGVDTEMEYNHAWFYRPL